MTRTALPKPEQVPADSKPTLDMFTKTIGFTPNMMGTFALSPIEQRDGARETQRPGASGWFVQLARFAVGRTMTMPIRTGTMPIRTGLRRLAPAAIAVGFLMIGMMSLAPVARAAADHLQIGVLIFGKVLTSDVTAPMEVFGNASKKPEFSQYQVAIIAPEKKLITTEEGIPIMPQYSIDDAPKLTALIVPSALKMDPLLENEKLMAFIKARGQEVKWLASNCAGAKLLGNAGLLEGRRATTYPGGEKWLKLHHPSIDVVWHQKVVVDETKSSKLVTSNGSLVSYQAALKMLELMTNADFSKKVADDIYYSILLSKN